MSARKSCRWNARSRGRSPRRKAARRRTSRSPSCPTPRTRRKCRAGADSISTLTTATRSARGAWPSMRSGICSTANRLQSSKAVGAAAGTSGPLRPTSNPWRIGSACSKGLPATSAHPWKAACVKSSRRTRSRADSAKACAHRGDGIPAPMRCRKSTGRMRTPSLPGCRCAYRGSGGVSRKWRFLSLMLPR